MQHISLDQADPRTASRTPPSSRWRVVDIVVASVVGVALGVVFFVWGFAYTGLEGPAKALYIRNAAKRAPRRGGAGR